jgi:hypothetical protein
VRQTFKGRVLPTLATAVLLAVTGAAGQAGAAPSAGAADPALRQVLLVGNNWEGTASVVSSDAALTPVGQINVIPDGDACVISESGADRITSLSFATGQKITSTAVGDHPQRVRLGKVPADWTGVG